VSDPQLSILLIDEDERTRNFFSAILSRQNFLIQSVSSGKEGYIIALRDKPDVIILDAGMIDMPAADLIRKLRSDRRSATTLCIALAEPSSSDKIPEILSAGCNEYFLKSPQSVEKLLNMLANPSQDENKDRKSAVGQKKKQIGGLLGVFISAKGGTGTSSLCANIAQNITVSSPKLNVAVIDLVFPIGSISSIVGYNGDFNIQTASRSAAELNKYTLRQKLEVVDNWKFRLLPGSPDPETANSIDIFQIPQVADAFQQAFDLTLIDMGRSLSVVNLSIIQQADVVVMVTGTDLNTVKLTRTAWNFLKQNGIKQHNIYTVLNRSIEQDGLSKSDAESILGIDIQAFIPYFGGALALANNQHLPILTKLPKNTAAVMMDQISREILETARRARA